MAPTCQVIVEHRQVALAAAVLIQLLRFLDEGVKLDEGVGARHRVHLHPRVGRGLLASQAGGPGWLPRARDLPTLQLSIAQVSACCVLVTAGPAV